MTQKLEHIIDQIRQLPDGDQDMFAAILEEAFLDHAAWRQKFAATQSQLGRLAAKVRADIQAGQGEDVDSVEL